jgi:hypothetical protein
MFRRTLESGRDEMQRFRGRVVWALVRTAIVLGALMLAGAQNWPKR